MAEQPEHWVLLVEHRGYDCNTKYDQLLSYFLEYYTWSMLSKVNSRTSE